ncbi:MAG TPA: glycerol-3-phosphate dehydrogenase [Candidatus Omnitrophica bacterium]|nr:MAG: glycerol-3-phosphate dehydrogenase [Omnitrophica WOR_2 bacterium GWA2_45_18]OGX20097.1 MAG: glycerol-3-phosphate dehydrogenase [Omnitrophica WOR_2 bacterium GWC2_45_7]HBR15535.1 glycerol-3-phosphate dehydrogenase [Candidatus Omnitrophota bacterium]
MLKKIKNIAIIGDGGWGTALSVHLIKKGYPVKLWGPFAPYLQQMRETRSNPKFLAGIPLPPELVLVDQLKEAFSGSDLLVFAVPSKYALDVLKKIRKEKIDFSNKIFLSVTKGIDNAHLLRISEIIQQQLGDIPLAVLSGPTIAREVAQGIPSTAVVAARDQRVARMAQEVFNTDSFRIYRNTDIPGVELGGSIKNIIAIACGVCDGLGFGSNTKAAILARGLAEMARLGRILGAHPKTFWGLSGLGDLVTTCFSPQSRNRTVGEQLGQGKTITEITSRMDMVAEGVETVKAVRKLSRRHKIPMPICDEVYNIIYKNKPCPAAVTDLMNRAMKAE